MLFSSLTFILLFLPFTAVFYFVIPKSWRNAFLLVMSMIFYAWGEPRFLAVMLLEIITVWAGAIGIGIAAERGSERLAGLLTALTVSSLVIILAIFKYLDFIIENAIRLTGAELTLPGIVLPLGISFYTFQALSYAIDVRRGNVKAERNIYTVALYISLFPQLVAGPIIKYHEIAAELRERESSVSDIADGVRRFIIGLGKKTLIANHLGEIADLGFGEDPAALGALPAWICAFAFTLQLFCNRPRAGIRLPLPGKLQVSLHLKDHFGVLAPLAHLTLDLVQGLPLHTPGRQPAWAQKDHSEPRLRIHRNRDLARPGLDLHGLGSAQRAPCHN